MEDYIKEQLEKELAEKAEYNNLSSANIESQFEKLCGD